MSANTWVTNDDVLNDLREVNGRNTGAEYLEQYVVRGEAPPPARQEVPDEDEIQYRFGRSATSAGNNITPDLKGISLMLQMVNDLDDPADSNDQKTIFMNTAMDEICISKLNPQVAEFVPGRNLEQKSDVSKKIQLETQSKFDKKGPVLVRKSEKNKIDKSKEHISENGHSSNISKKIKELSNDNLNNNNISLKPLNGKITREPIGKTAKDSPAQSSTSTPSLSKTALNDVGDNYLDRKLDIDSMKSDEIEAMKEKIKSKIITSSKENSLKHKREKNVAIATLLKLCSAPKIPDDGNSVKLVMPNYFEVPPTKEEIVQIPDTTSSVKQQSNYVDPLVQESISKVNEWFDSTGSPKRKPQAVVPVKEPVALKNKTTSSPSMRSTPKSDAMRSTPESTEKKGCGDFVPSSYANDLRKKYETNAKKVIMQREDLGTMLERQLKERDEQIKKKLLEKKESMSPGSGRSVQ